MKKFIKIFSVVIILSIICSTCMFACKKDDNTKKEEKDSLSYTFVTSKQISFGSYPQTIAKNVELSDIKTGEYDESTGYYKYNGKTYAIITATPSVEDATFSNGSSVIAGQEYAFVVEDIIWNIIYSKEDNAFVCMSNKILDITNFQNIANIAGDSTERYFYKDDEGVKYNGGDKWVYANSYEYSTLRKFANTFYKKAFNTNQVKDIVVTTVDNKTKYNNNNAFTSVQKNTEDKIYSLSVNEATRSTYGFVDSGDIATNKRLTEVSDYAIAKGVLFAIRTKDKVERRYGEWWLRSPYGNEHAASVYFVTTQGNISSTALVSEDFRDTETYKGFLPIVRVRKSA